MKTHIINKLEKIKEGLLKTMSSNSKEETYRYLRSKFSTLERIQSDIIELYSDKSDPLSFTESDIYLSIKHLVDISEDAGVRSDNDYYKASTFLNECDFIFNYIQNH